MATKGSKVDTFVDAPRGIELDIRLVRPKREERFNPYFYTTWQGVEIENENLAELHKEITKRVEETASLDWVAVIVLILAEQTTNFSAPTYGFGFSIERM